MFFLPLCKKVVILNLIQGLPFYKQLMRKIPYQVRNDFILYNVITTLSKVQIPLAGFNFSQVILNQFMNGGVRRKGLFGCAFNKCVPFGF